MNKITKNPFLIIRIGLALVFLANGLGAFFSGEEVQGLISGSFVSHIIPLSAATLVLIVGIHDILMCVLILATRKYQRYLFGWAMIWIVIVMAVIAEPLDIVEHLGFFAMALALFTQAPRKEVLV